MKLCLVLTHQCNLACSYCYAGEKFKQAMSLKDGLRSLAFALNRIKPGQTLEISYFGGEPMVAFDRMVELSRIAKRWSQRKRSQIRFAVTTNGTILSDKQLQFLKSYDFFVGFSLDGLPETQDRQRPFAGGRGSGDLVWRNLERAVEHLRALRVLTVVRPESLGELPVGLERLYRLGVSRISLLPDMEADWTPVRELLEEVYHRLARISYFSTLTEEPLWISPFSELIKQSTSVGPGRQECRFGDNELAVSPLGNFYPCARLVGPDRRVEVRIGNLDQGLDPLRVSSLQQLADETLSNCGSGGCRCLALMPGEQTLQIENVSMFTALAGRATRAATEVRSEVAV